MENLEQELEVLEKELDNKEEELSRLKTNSAFQNLEKLLTHTKELLTKMEQIQLDPKQENQHKIWEILTMKVPKHEYLQLKLENYLQGNSRLEELMIDKREELNQNLSDFKNLDQRRRFLETEIESLKKIERLKERFFGILWEMSQNGKESYREKILKASLKEKEEGKSYKKTGK